MTTNPDDLEQEEPTNVPAYVPPTVPAPANSPREIGGRDGPEPTRFGDWELRGRCIDF
ncbi:MAG TPA: DUF1674 domain-containing protein [Steroidobacteraceae bacterium]|nr:DUF1674 domain-containing protein [Steroidobacteraceae bacterium]